MGLWDFREKQQKAVIEQEKALLKAKMEAQIAHLRTKTNKNMSEEVKEKVEVLPQGTPYAWTGPDGNLWTKYPDGRIYKNGMLYEEEKIPPITYGSAGDMKTGKGLWEQISMPAPRSYSIASSDFSFNDNSGTAIMPSDEIVTEKQPEESAKSKFDRELEEYANSFIADYKKRPIKVVQQPSSIPYTDSAGNAYHNWLGDYKPATVYTGTLNDESFNAPQPQKIVILQSEYDELKANQKEKENENTCMIFIENMARKMALNELALKHGMDASNEAKLIFDEEEYNPVYDKHYDFIFSFQVK